VAGDGTEEYKGDGGQATSAGLYNPRGVAVDASGNIYIADSMNYRIRMVTKSTGIITTVAGDGTREHKGDGGQATSAGLGFPTGVAVDASGNIYIADESNDRIRMVTKSTGIITTVAGNGYFDDGGDGGQATSAGLRNPHGVAVDASGNIYIADDLNHRVRMVMKSTGIITTVAGDGTAGFKGDEGQATSAGLYNPRGVAVDASGNIYIADSMNYRLRMVTKSTGIITTVAGDGTATYNYKGDDRVKATSTGLNPLGVAVDASGNIYIADGKRNRIRMVTKSTGNITTEAGTGMPGYSSDGGPAKSASLSYPRGVAVDASGNIYIADTENNRIRMISANVEAPITLPNTSPTPAPTHRPTSSPTTAPPTIINSPRPTDFYTPYPTIINTPRPTDFYTPYPTIINTPRPTDFYTPYPTIINTPRPTDFYTPHPTIINTPRPTDFYTPYPTIINTPRPTDFYTPYPTIINTPRPTDFYTPEPTPFPTSAKPIVVIPADCKPSFHTRDYYVDGVQYEKCVKCPPESYTSGKSDVCFSCPSGTMVNAERTGCVDIAPITTPTPSPDEDTVVAFYIDCEPSFYIAIFFSNGSQGQYCKKCPPDSYTTGGPSVVCSKCPSGKVVNDEQTGCRLYLPVRHLV
jgi:sugar lactone lactonase YvrE